MGTVSATASAIDTAGQAAPRILIVDDSVVVRTVLARMVADARRFVLTAAVPDVRRALQVLAVEKVDLILLDIEMPGVDGLSALPGLIAASGGARVLIVSSTCDDGAAATIRALALGAADTLVKPGVGGLSGRFQDALIEKIERLTERVIMPAARAPGALPVVDAFDVVAIGASTGGIHALGGVLGAITPDFRRPILITQHLPSSFMPYFAAQVAVLAGRPCDVAEDRTRLRTDRVLIAPGDAHLTVVPLPGGGGAIRLSTEPVANGNVPSVDPMLATLASTYGSRLLAIILSGMGRDGLDGARRVRAAGGAVVVQDPASSVVWGMPGGVVEAGLADAVLTPAEIGAFVAGGRRAS